jgi:hypothetical protein
MTWEIIYHKDVDDDLKSVGPAAARRDKQIYQSASKRI